MSNSCPFSLWCVAVKVCAECLAQTLQLPKSFQKVRHSSSFTSAFHRQVSTYLQHFTKWKDRTHSCGNSTCNKWIASQTCPQLHLRPKFGWVLAWKTNTSNLSYCSVTSHHVSVASSDDFLHKFWEVEENHRATPTFEEGHRRSDTVRFMPRKP